MKSSRRTLLAAAATLALPGLVRAQHQGHHQGQFERLNQPGRIDLPDLHAQQAVTDSPAPRAAQQGAWRARAPLPIPRTEMAWAVAYRDRMHLVGGYAQQRVDRPYHHAYDPATDQWQELPQLPRGANHVGVATLGERLYAFGGFIEQNRTPHDEAFAFDGEKWTRVRRLPEACGAMACIALGTRIHLIGGAIGSDWRRSIDWHVVYDPDTDRYERRQPLPVARDHIGIVVVDNAIHVVGGPRRLFPHQQQPASQLRRCRPIAGLFALPCRPRVPAMAACSTATRCSSWAAKAPTACTARTRPGTR